VKRKWEKEEGEEKEKTLSADEMVVVERL